LILKAQVYIANLWWPVFILISMAIIILLGAYYFNLSRDLGEGIIPAKPGRKNASRFLQSPFGLSVRLFRNVFIGWSITMLLLGITYGSVLGDFGTFLESNDFFKQILNVDSEFSMVEQFVTMLMSIMTIVATIPAVTAILKIRNEEKKGRTEHLLARNVSKLKLLTGYFIISIITSVIMVFLVVFGLWSAAYIVMENPISFSTLFIAGMTYLPAIWVMISIALLLIDYLPRLTSIIWTYIGFSLFAVYLGKLINLPEWVSKLTPFGYIKQFPVEDINIYSITILSIIAILFTSIGFIKYKKREMIS